MNLILIGSMASLLAGLATGIGALFILFTRSVSDQFLDCSLGFAAGIMLAATFFSLIIPALDLGGIGVTTLGIGLGTLFLISLESLTPHIHAVTGLQGLPTHLPRLWLFILAMAIHNFPEGMAVGISFGGGDLRAGLSLAIGIGLHNIPEGLAIAFPLFREEGNTWKAFLLALLTGLVEPIGGFLGISIVSLAESLLPYGLSFAAGAMLFVITAEIIPETLKRGNERKASLSLIIGFLFMMILEHLFHH